MLKRELISNLNCQCEIKFRGDDNGEYVKSLLLICLIKVIQVISAVDADDPAEGHHFYFSMVPEKNINPNFTIRDNQGAVHHTGIKYNSFLC